jgi:Transmembrane domain of unknown function (DUF3566)
VTSYGNADYPLGARAPEGSSAVASGHGVAPGTASLTSAPAKPAGPSAPPQYPTTSPAPSPTEAGTGAPPANGQVKGSSTPTPVAGGRIPPKAPTPSVPTAKAGRKARLRLARVDPWSVMKLAFLLSIAAGIVVIVAVAGLWLMLEYMGVWSSLGTTIRDVTGGNETEGFNLERAVSLGRVTGFATLLSVVNVFIITALATLAAFLYNLAATFVGGLEVILADPE